MIKSVYIHIPFCKNICTYCDFTKMFYIKKYVNDYLDALNNEIKTIYQKEKLNTLYIGGGTPSSLDKENLKKLFTIIKQFNLNKKYEFTFECNINDIEETLLKLLKQNRVNRISIGIESFNQDNLKYLNRKHNKKEIKEKIELVKKYFENINVDLIYALPIETLETLKEDVNDFIKLDVPHISTYSLIIEPHTILYKNEEKYIDEDLDFAMYEYIVNTLKKENYNHYEISNFAKKGFEAKHNLVYWNNLNYYGFGLGASGYINNTRYTNTKNLFEYLKGNYKQEEKKLTKKEQMEEEMFLGLRKIKGVSDKQFYKKYNIKIEEQFNIEDLIESKKLIKNKEYIKINKKYIYVSNDILINFIGDDYE